MIETRQIKVLIVDDHPLMRTGLSSEINVQTDMRVVAEASDGEDAIERFRAHRPDITLMGYPDAWHRRYRSDLTHPRRVLECTHHYPHHCRRRRPRLSVHFKLVRWGIY